MSCVLLPLCTVFRSEETTELVCCLSDRGSWCTVLLVLGAQLHFPAAKLSPRLCVHSLRPLTPPNSFRWCLCSIHACSMSSHAYSRCPASGTPAIFALVALPCSVCCSFSCFLGPHPFAPVPLILWLFTCCCFILVASLLMRVRCAHGIRKACLVGWRCLLSSFLSDVLSQCVPQTAHALASYIQAAWCQTASMGSTTVQAGVMRPEGAPAACAPAFRRTAAQYC